MTPISGAGLRARATVLVAFVSCLVSSASVSIGPHPALAVPSRFAMGKPLFATACGRCHQIGIGAGNGIVPDLNGIIGAPAGVVPGYEYSSADKRSAMIWTRPAFDAYIENPQADMPETRMAMAGIASKAERDAIYAYVAGYDADGTNRTRKPR